MVISAPFIEHITTARDQGARYLAQAQRADGAIGEPERDGAGPYYKAPWAFAAAGMPDAGNRLASWLAHNLLSPEGDFAGPLRGDNLKYAYSYANAWMTIGAHKLGRYDLSIKAVPFLLSMQHPRDGGFRMTPGDPDLQDVLCTSQAGNACLLTGHKDPAVRAGEFLRAAFDAQPSPKSELFFTWKQGLRTEYPAERQRLYSIRADTPRQAYFNAGIAAAFLARLSMATDDRAWADLGARYLGIAFNTLDEMYETAQVGKVGWGAALVFAVTREERMRALAERVGEAMIAQQDAGGGWDNTGGFVSDAIRQEVTAEFIVLLDEMAGGLAS